MKAYKYHLKKDKLYNNDIARCIECIAAYSYTTGSISEIHERLLEHGYRVSKNAIRQWIKDGFLPASYIGKKAYIHFENVLDILKNGTPIVNKGDDPIKGIRKIG